MMEMYDIFKEYNEWCEQTGKDYRDKNNLYQWVTEIKKITQCSPDQFEFMRDQWNSEK